MSRDRKLHLAIFSREPPWLNILLENSKASQMLQDVRPSVIANCNRHESAFLYAFVCNPLPLVYQVNPPGPNPHPRVIAEHYKRSTSSFILCKRACAFSMDQKMYVNTEHQRKKRHKSRKDSVQPPIWVVLIGGYDRQNIRTWLKYLTTGLGAPSSPHSPRPHAQQSRC